MDVVLSDNSLLSIAGAPVYISNPHFYLADPNLLEEVEGLSPNKSLHESYFKIQPVILVSFLV